MCLKLKGCSSLGGLNEQGKFQVGPNLAKLKLSSDAQQKMHCLFVVIATCKGY